MRTTSGKVMPPRVRQRYRPTCVISWSRHGYENASYCISQTGRQPAMHRPTAVPRMPASESGVSTQRSAPKRSRSPAVARKTPPARPTSSPITITDSSRSISVWSASLTASTSVLSAIAQVRWGIDVGVLEDELRIGLRQRLRGRDTVAHGGESLLPCLLGEGVGQYADPAKVTVVASEALVLPLLFDAVRVDVCARIVGGGVRRTPI